MVESDDTYFLSQDNDCHWYVIPVRYRSEWLDFLDLDTDDPTTWDVPEWADRVEGSPSLIIFNKYKKA